MQILQMEGPESICGIFVDYGPVGPVVVEWVVGARGGEQRVDDFEAGGVEGGQVGVGLKTLGGSDTGVEQCAGAGSIGILPRGSIDQVICKRALWIEGRADKLGLMGLQNELILEERRLVGDLGSLRAPGSFHGTCILSGWIKG